MLNTWFLLHLPYHPTSVYCVCTKYYALGHLLVFSRSVMSDLWPRGLQHIRLPCHSPSPSICSNSCPLSWWCHQTISSPVVPFSYLQSFPAAGPFPISRLFTLGSQRIGASASVLPMYIQGSFPLELIPLDSGAGEYSWESLGQQGGQTSQS